MNAALTATILRQLEPTDAELLARFAASKDADTFAELVRRHGPLVLGVCRRVTGHPQDAEDAFQAVFLVLAKKAGSLRTPELLGNFLYGVAFRVASRARRSAVRRKAREVQMAAPPDPPAPTVQTAHPELARILDAELAQLPACYREAIVLCDLRGQSREAAAAALGVPEGTVSSRLANGRKKLAARLARRGVSLSAALPLLVGEVQAVSSELVAKTCGLVSHWAAGGAVPVALAKLVNGGLSVRTIFILGFTMLAVVAGAVFAAQPRHEKPPVDPSQPPAAAAKPDPAPVPKDLPKEKERPVGFTDKPRMLRSFDTDFSSPPSARWNDVGTHLALAGSEYVNPAGGSAMTFWSVKVYSLDAKGEPRTARTAAPGSLVAVTADGDVVTDLREYDLISGRHQLKFWAYDPKAKFATLRANQTVDLDLPETQGYAFAAGMKMFRTVSYLRDASGNPKQIEALEVDAATGKAAKSLMKVDYGFHALSENGKRLAVLDPDGKRVTVYDLDRGAKVGSTAVVDPSPDMPAPPLGDERYVVLSPDGSRYVVYNGLGRTTVYNSDTGENLPLEGMKDTSLRFGPQSMTGDGRLLAALGRRYKVTTSRPKADGREQKGYNLDGQFLGVWDTQTGKVLKTWDRGKNAAAPWVAFNPARPLLAVIEPTRPLKVVLDPNTDNQVRVGFWDFAAEVAKK